MSIPQGGQADCAEGQLGRAGVCTTPGFLRRQVADLALPWPKRFGTDGNAARSVKLTGAWQG